MKRNDTIRHIGLWAAGLSLLTGCSKSHTEPAREGAIGFTTAVTRSAVTSLGNDGDAFAVWARETPPEGTPRLILTGETVTCAEGRWSYDNLRYWKNGATYDFHALYPAGQAASLEGTATGETPYLRITDFDATQGTDLMAAEKTGFAYQPPAQPVAFTFRHLLSQVRIVGRIDPALDASGGVSARITSAKLYGMPATGSCSVPPGGNGTWEFGAATDADGNPFAVNTVPQELTASGTPVFAGDLLLFPQPVGKGFTLEIEYEYTEGNTTDALSKSISLADAGIDAWEAGRSYRYTFTLGSEYILFERPEVVPWSSASGGSITVE